MLRKDVIGGLLVDPSAVDMNRVFRELDREDREDGHMEPLEQLESSRSESGCAISEI
jgi:hypothetical protein